MVFEVVVVVKLPNNDGFSRRVKLKTKLNQMLSQANAIAAWQYIGFERSV